MPSTMKNISPVLVELNIEVTPDEIQSSMNKAYSQLSREAKVRGFRKGKVPRAVLKRMFGEAVLSDLKGDLVSKAFFDAIKEHELNPIGEPDFDVSGDVSEGAPYNFKVKVETSPRLEQINYEGIELEKTPVVVDASTVDRELERLRSAMATAADLDEARPAALGDLVKLQMRKWVDGEWKEPATKPQELVLEEGSVPNEILDSLPGMNVDDEKEIVFGESAEGEEPNKFLCKIVSLQERRLPELDDEFAKDLGDFDTLAQLREDIEKRVGESLEKTENDRLRHAMFDALREKNPMDLPERLLTQQVQMMKMQFAGMMGASGDGDDEAMKKLDESTEKAARDIVHQHFLIEEIARHGDLEVSDEDLEADILQMSAHSGLPVPKLKAELAKSNRLGEMKTNIIERKVFDFVLPKVKIVDADPDAKKADDEGEG